MSDRNDPKSERDAIMAELAALGEDELEASELQRAEAFGEAGSADEGLAALSLLRLSGRSASLGDERSEQLLGGLMAQLEDEGDARRLGDAVDVMVGRAALDDHGEPQPEGLEDALAAVARIRVAQASRSPRRSAELYDEVAEELRPSAPVIDLASRRRARLQLTFAAAAAVLLVVIGAFLWRTLDSELERPVAPAGTVAQVELIEAEQRLDAQQRKALELLLAADDDAAPTPKGDHLLRDLRDARRGAVRARTQAAVRRL